MKNYWVDSSNERWKRDPNNHNNYCIACRKTFWFWFHGQGMICEECSEKGVTRETLLPDIGQVLRKD